VRDAASAKQSAISVHKLPTTNHASGEWLPARRCNAAGKRKIPEPRMPLMPRPKQSISVSWRAGRVTSQHYPPVPRRARVLCRVGLVGALLAEGEPRHAACETLQRSLWRVHTPERFPPRRRSALSAGLFQDSSAAAAIPACHATANIFLAIGDRTRRSRGRKLRNDHETKLRPRPHGSLSCEFESLTRDRAGA